MTDLKFCEPNDIPAEFSEYNEKITQLEVGKTGKIGILKLKLENDAKIVRKNKPYVLVNCKTDEGIDVVVRHIVEDLLFEQPPKKLVTNAK